MNKRLMTKKELFKVLRENLADADDDADVFFRVDLDELDHEEVGKGLSINLIETYHCGTEINIGLGTAVPQYVGKTLIGYAEK